MSLPGLTINAQSSVKGDVNEDGKLNISDVTTLINWLLGGVPETLESKLFTVNGVTFKMVAVEGGTFTMGATEEQALAGAEGIEYPAMNPAGPESGTYRVDRGGNWYFNAAGCRVSHRYPMPPSSVYDNIGFRIAL